MKYYSIFAQAYGQGSYGDCTYNNTTNQCSTSAGGTSGGNSGSGNGLANTGIALTMLLTLACLIVFASLIIRVWRRKPVVQEIQEVNQEEEKRLSDRF